MARPINCRDIRVAPSSTYFKPRGIPKSALVVQVLTLDELEALRLADLEGLYHSTAAKNMNVSRQTFDRIVDKARKKVAQALIGGQGIEIKGGEVKMTGRKFLCYDCQHKWEVPYGTGKVNGCPSCKSTHIHRAQEDCDSGRKKGRLGRRGQCGRKNDAHRFAGSHN